MKNPTKIIIAEDRVEYRVALIRELSEENIITIGEANNGMELTSLLEQGLKPDVILLDLRMPEMNGSEAFSILMSVYPWVNVIIVSLYDDQELMEDYIDRGAKGYISKHQISKDLQQLTDAIRRVSKGLIYPIFKDGKPRQKYTRKQKEIIGLICKDMSKKEIADELGVTRSAVDKAEKRLMTKMNMKTREGLFSAFFDLGWNFFGIRSKKKVNTLRI